MYRSLARWILMNLYVERLAALVLTAITLFMFVNVVLRYAFNAPIAWGDEVMQFAFIWFVFIGAVAAMKSGSHFSVTLLLDQLPRPIAAVIKVTGDLAVIAICATFIWYGLQVTMLFSFQLSPSLEIPMTFVNASLPLASLLMLVVRAVQMVERVRVDLLGNAPLSTATPKGGTTSTVI
jgi:TRAP-type C4-dicarboxylate transport system permease small subunit